MRIASLTFLLLAIAAGSALAQQEPDPELRKLLRSAANEADSFPDRFDAQVWLSDMSGRLARQGAGSHSVLWARAEELLLDEWGDVRLAHGQPHGAGPDTRRSEGHGGGCLATARDPTRAEHRGRCHGSDEVGDQNHRPDLAGVAPGLGPLGDDDVDAGLLLSLRVLDGTCESGDLHAVLMSQIDDVLGRRAECVYEKLDAFVAQGHVDVIASATFRPAEESGAATADARVAGLEVVG